MVDKKAEKRIRSRRRTAPHHCVMKYLTLTPNGDAGTNELNLIGVGLTRHYEAIDDPYSILPDYYTSYLQPSAPTYSGTESFTLPNHTIQHGKIDCVILGAVVNRANLTNDVSIQMHIWNAGFVNIQSATPITGLTAHPNWASVGSIFTTNPEGNPWTWNDVDSLIAGFTASSASLTALNVTQFIVMIHYCE